MFSPARNQFPPGPGFGMPPGPQQPFGPQGFQSPTQGFRGSRRGGGILSKLRQRRQSPGGFQGFQGNRGFQGFQGFQGAQNLQRGGGFTNVLGNMQQVLQVAQTATPMIQQYAPMIRNIPMMINLWKIMREPDDDNAETEQTESESSSSSQLEVESGESSKTLDEFASSNESSSKPYEKKVRKRRQGTSQPKLFI
ncbi:VrrA/YqfQ family protein [Thalassobacillus hwangdonensis]|uniref:VrrA/YqfQ family protein n=1 Tax=Thalassobacillus hwangdonensis TaxID=546108 RepID=A0ABW3KXP0_9BACI